MDTTDLDSDPQNCSISTDLHSKFGPISKRIRIHSPTTTIYQKRAKSNEFVYLLLKKTYRDSEKLHGPVAYFRTHVPEIINII
jgi:hypothetical protein